MLLKNVTNNIDEYILMKENLKATQKELPYKQLERKIMVDIMTQVVNKYDIKTTKEDANVIADSYNEQK